MEYAICTVLIGLNSITQIEMLRQYCSAMLNSRNYKHQIILTDYVIIVVQYCKTNTVMNAFICAMHGKAVLEH